MSATQYRKPLKSVVFSPEQRIHDPLFIKSNSATICSCSTNSRQLEASVMSAKSVVFLMSRYFTLSSEPALSKLRFDKVLTEKRAQ